MYISEDLQVVEPAIFVCDGAKKCGFGPFSMDLQNPQKIGFDCVFLWHLCYTSPNIGFTQLHKNLNFPMEMSPNGYQHGIYVPCLTARSLEGEL